MVIYKKAHSQYCHWSLLLKDISPMQQGALIPSLPMAPCDKCIVTCDKCIVTCDNCIVTCANCIVTCANCIVTCDKCIVTCDNCIVTCDNCIVTCLYVLNLDHDQNAGNTAYIYMEQPPHHVQNCMK